MENVKGFLKRKNIVFSAKRYGVDALGAMAQGLFASLLIGTIISTLGTQLHLPYLEEVGGYAKSMAGPAMAVAIGYALKCPPLVLFSLIAVGAAATEAGYPMEPGELFAAGQEYTDNLLKSCNGGAEYPIEGWEDSYEMFLAALGRYEAGEASPSALQ